MENIDIINGNDSISESREKINRNFYALSTIESRIKKQYADYATSVNEKIEDIEGVVFSKTNTLLNKIDDVGQRIENIPTIESLQREVSNAIESADSTLGRAIVELAGRQVGESMGEYAKTVDVQNGYVGTTAFENYKSDSKERQASASIIAANNKFYIDNGYLVLLENNQKSPFRNINEYYESLSAQQKAQFDPNGTGLSDATVLNAFIGLCETTFKTVSTELAGFTTKVAEDMAELDILAQISNDDGKQISAAIITQVNESGSSIKLNAGHLNLAGDEFVVNTSNFKVNTSGNGNVEVTGAITATSLTIGSGSSGKTLNDYINTTWATKEELSTGLSNIESQLTDDTWLTGAFGQTDISNGVILTGNVLAADNSNKVTAGMLGGNASDTTANDLRFFAGSEFSNRQSAPFRVYENGELWATNAHITGAIEATSLIISPDTSAASTFTSLVDSAVSPTLSNYATKSFVSNAVASVSSYDDDWLMSAFDKTTISAGLVLTGNVVTMDASSNPTAGMMGGSNLRFFAGSSDLSSAPFRVYKDGSLYATNANITGKITATELVINPSSSAASTFTSLVDSAVSPTLSNYVTNSSLSSTLNNYVQATTLSNYVQTTTLNGYTTTSALTSALSNYPTNSTLSSTLSNYPTNSTLSSTLSNYATKSDLSNIQTYDDGWVTKAFNKTLIQGGLAMTGNIFVADNSGNITAGMMGANSGNDLRFFAGGDNTNASTAPFRVYEDGSMFASNADITGKITVQTLNMPFVEISVGDYTYSINSPCNIILPRYNGGSTSYLRLPQNDSSLNGQRIMVKWPQMRTSMESDHKITGKIRCPNKDTIRDSTLHTYNIYYASELQSYADGIAEFLCIDGEWWLLSSYGLIDYISY